MAKTVTDAQIATALSPETVSATERALLRRVLDLEERMRVLEGDWHRELELTGAGFLTQVADDQTG